MPIVCVPKHVVCGDYTPSFTPSNTPCTMDSYAVTRARLQSGSFFRSIENGNIGNSLSVVSEMQVFDVGVWRIYDSGAGDLLTDIARVEIVFDDGVLSEAYSAPQSGSMSLPPNPQFSWNVSAIPSLRSQINANSNMITMPTADIPSGWNSGVDDDDHMASFSGQLSGGGGTPTSPTSIRTGPFESLINISSTETPNDDFADKLNNGESSPPSGTSMMHWTGAIFEPYNGTICYDPENPGAC